MTDIEETIQICKHDYVSGDFESDELLEYLKDTLVEDIRQASYIRRGT
ncbi:23604_t:CDS:2 [Gigaspora margarita]|uniref:23604_t:CDS:1 n=1 Tax=Gigaspora margarita TaxID=4874 RepID=A0ABN7V1D0_GIGMA|nr:23604_t:CDS:2 [Gigaspora margarita]